VDKIRPVGKRQAQRPFRGIVAPWDAAARHPDRSRQSASLCPQFPHAAQREEPSPEDICAVLAAVIARDLGVYTMAQVTSDVTYEQLKRIRGPASDRRGAAERLG
jgi:hypothetical protein